MIAHYRADVRELNGRARAVMRSAGRLGPDELVAAGSRYAVGDRDRHQAQQRPPRRPQQRARRRGSGRPPRREPVGPHRRPRRRARREVPRQHAARWPAHARARLRDDRPLRPGLTCRHALVLARDDTYKEWVYTAMTRTTTANRLYVIAERTAAATNSHPPSPPRRTHAARRRPHAKPSGPARHPAPNREPSDRPRHREVIARVIRRRAAPTIARTRGTRAPRTPASPGHWSRIAKLGRTLSKRAADVLACFDRPGTSNGPTEAINGRLEHLPGSALGLRNLTKTTSPGPSRDRRIQTPTTPCIGEEPLFLGVGQRDDGDRQPVILS